MGSNFSNGKKINVESALLSFSPASVEHEECLSGVLHFKSLQGRQASAGNEEYS